MQRIGNLYDQFCSFPNLYCAWKKARKGSGPKPDSALFFQDLEKELFDLQETLVQETWQPRPYRFFNIFDPKHRCIAVADFRDRVVHHALVNVLEPVFEKIFISDSFATRKEKGVHAAIFRAQDFLRSHEYFLKTDIEKYFDSIRHDVLLHTIAEKIKDKRLLCLCEKIITHGGQNGAGVPIGNRTSQFFANVYLNPLDHFIKERLQVKGYVRYMDDFVLFDQDNIRLKKWKAEISHFLEDTLQLQLKPSATFFNRRQNGLPFLGRRIFPSIIRLRTNNLRRITRRISIREEQFRQGDISEETFLHSMNSYWAMLSFYPELKPLRNSLLTK